VKKAMGEKKVLEGRRGGFLQAEKRRGRDGTLSLKE